MNFEEKILLFLKGKKVVNSSTLSEIKTTENTNKLGEQLYFVKASILEKQVATAFFNSAIYYGFNSTGDYIGCVKVSVLNVNPPSKVEMEYWANEKYKDQGNITALALDVIEDIFNKRTFDGLKVRNVFPLSNITSIMVSINKDNYASFVCLSICLSNYIYEHV